MHEHKVVTAHAILRWLERVEKFDLHPVKVEMRQEGLDVNAPGEVLKHLWRTREINVSDIANDMVSPTVLQAIKIQARSIRHKGAILILSGGRIATVITEEMGEQASRKFYANVKRRQEKTRSRNGRKANRRADYYADTSGA